MAIEKIFLGTTTGDKTGDGAREAGQKINNNFEYLETKIDNQNIILVNAGYALSGNIVTFNAGWQWKINGIDYTNPESVQITLPYCAAGNKRIDSVVLNTSNTFSKITGTETTSNPVTENLPHTIKVAEFLISQTAVSDTAVIAPYLGSVVPSSTPDGIGTATWTATQAGTYVNFGNVVVNANSFAIISRNASGVFTISQTALTLTEYAKIVDVQNSLASTETAKPLSAYQGKVLNENKADKDIVNSIVLALEEKQGVLSNGYIDKTTGNFVSNASWRCTDFLIVNKNTLVKRTGNAIASTSNVAGISFYDSNKAYLGFYTNIPASLLIKVSDYYATAVFIKVSSSSTILPVVLLKSSIVNDVEINTEKLFLSVKTVDFGLTYTNGYCDATGSYIDGASWRSTDFIKTEPTCIFKYKGITVSVARSVSCYDINKTYISTLLGVVDSLSGYTEVVVPENAYYVRASGRVSVGGDVFSFVGNDRVVDRILPSFFMPTKLWAKQNDNFRINPYGIIAKNQNENSTDLIWQFQNSNEKFLNFTPSSTDDISIGLSIRNSFNEIKSLGTTVLKITPTTNIINPSTAQNFICLGDSLTEGVGSINGAYANELSRRLKGVGTALLSGSESPAALALTNIYFRGTLGDQPVKTEGRGGWKASDYFNYSELSGVTNAFWNPAIPGFDMDYYLTQNNFNAAQTTGGVNSTGSNLTMIILLGWNNAYATGGLAKGVSDLKLLIDKIKLQKSGVKIKIVGLNTPPSMNQKAYSGVRNVSAESIMSEVIIPYNIAYNALASNVLYSSYVEFIAVSAVLFPDKSYPSTTVNSSFRNSDQVTVYTDYVHPNERGYAQISDAIFYNLLYNYCKS